MEGRESTKRNADQPTTFRAQYREDVTGGLARIRQAAKRDKEAKFTSLLHHCTPEFLESSFYELRRNAAVGVDEVTWQEYQKDVKVSIKRLHENVHKGTYRAQPSRRVYIEKADGKKRPLGVASLEDKIVQQAIRRILEHIYEEDFVSFSHGFRPGRSQHNALDALYVGISQRKVSWVLDMDIEAFFDTMSHEWILEFVGHRVSDKRVLRLIRKWLKAGIVEEGKWKKTTVGTPQGAVISPLLANIYLHYVFDLWTEKWRQKKAKGEVIVVRYADDSVLGFQNQSDAILYKQELEERFSCFGLKLHPVKTRLIEFGRFASDGRKKRGEGKPETFDFLGFTHICGKTKLNKKFIIRRVSIQSKVVKKLKLIKYALMKRRFLNVHDQGKWLRSVIVGWLNYHAVPGNGGALWRFVSRVTRHWHRALQRRSQKGRRLTWAKFARFIKLYIPYVKTLHPYPNERLVVNYSR